MFTKVGSKSLAANNDRINEDGEDNSKGYCCKYMHVIILKCMHSECESANIVPLIVFRLTINALLLVMSASSVMVRLAFFINQFDLFGAVPNCRLYINNVCGHHDITQWFVNSYLEVLCLSLCCYFWSHS